jgi:hypothetical protein
MRKRIRLTAPVELDADFIERAIAAGELTEGSCWEPDTLAALLARLAKAHRFHANLCHGVTPDAGGFGLGFVRKVKD